eukprot:g6873.t1
MVSIPGSFVSLGCSMLLSVLLALLPFLVMISSPEGAKWVYGLSSVVSVLIAIGFHMTAASLQPLTPTQRKLRRHIKNMAGCNPNPMLTRREKGPHRAIRAGHLLDLATTFHDCIRHRDMYYVATNIIKPDKEMISKLVSEMPGGFQAMNAYLKRNIAEALRTMQVVFTTELKNLLTTLDTAQLEHQLEGLEDSPSFCEVAIAMEEGDEDEDEPLPETVHC